LSHTLKTPSLYGSFIVILGAIMFAAKAIFIKLAYRYHIDSISLLALRMIFAFPFFAFFATMDYKKNGLQHINNKIWVKIIALGILGYYISSMLDFWGLEYIPAGMERLILFVYPTMVVLISALFFSKPITKVQILALFITYSGILFAYHLELLHPSATNQSNPNLLFGAGLIFLCALTYAIYYIYSGELIPKIGSVIFTNYVMMSAAVVVVLHYCIAGKANIFAQPIEVYGLALLLATISTVIPTFLISKGVGMIGASNASILSSIGPMATILMAYYALNETVNINQIIGMLLVLCGVLTISLKK
jgi:drug/metabolite transporter (DMT)-like permease